MVTFNTTYRSRKEILDEMFHKEQIRYLKKLPGMFMFQVVLMAINVGVSIGRTVDLIDHFEWLLVGLLLIQYAATFAISWGCYRTRKEYFRLKNNMILDAL